MITKITGKTTVDELNKVLGFINCVEGQDHYLRMWTSDVIGFVSRADSSDCICDYQLADYIAKHTTLTGEDK